MKSREFCRLAGRILRQDTAPYFEQEVRAEAEKICQENGLDYELDEFGNLHVRVITDSRQRPLVFAAHMDHPGFEVIRRISQRKWLLRFRGGVGRKYFKAGVRVRLMPGAVRARLAPKNNRKQLAKLPLFIAAAERALTQKFHFAVWDLKAFEVRNERIHARACDDLVGVSAVLAACIELKESRAPVNVTGVLSRAEEVGFQGALALADASANARKRSKISRALLPKNSLVISLETSRELPGVKMGAGVIIRTGDRASIFHSRATRFLTEVATELTHKKREFRFQRALMSGGTCEATAYQEFGFDSAAVCIALGNYHNCGPNSRIASEYVSVRDGCNMVSLLVAAARRLRDYERLTGRLNLRLEKLLREARRRLGASF